MTGRTLVFEENRGQADAEVQFVARGAGYTAFLTSIEMVLRRVTYVAPLPDGTKESQRTVTIKFSVKAKRALG